ncbi:MAG: helix-hairpin-helix domain-containing protein, partial [Sulfurovum sp.]|nr:helix-hairpin-helix domain-containing protein [Sulfurovum sp.]
MLKKVTLGFLVLTITSVCAMSLNQLNSASKAELIEINGIGEAKAAAIIKERKKSKFKSFDDLTRVKGVGPSIASNIKKDVKS